MGIRADFATYRPVPTRKVLQLIFEVPIEHQAEVFAKLGFPVPDGSTWCEIALLETPVSQPGSRPPVSLPVSPTGPKRESPSTRASSEGANEPVDKRNLQNESQRSLAAKERYAAAGEMERAVYDAAMLANDPAFWREAGVYGSEAAAEAIRKLCQVASRREFATDLEAYERFKRLQTDFMAATGRLAESR